MIYLKWNTHFNIHIYLKWIYIWNHEICRDNWNTGITVRDFNRIKTLVHPLISCFQEREYSHCFYESKQVFLLQNSLVKGWSVKCPGAGVSNPDQFFSVRRYLTVNLILGIWTPPNLPLDLGTSLNTSLKQNLQVDQSPSTLAFLPPKADFCLFFFMNFGWLGDSCS